jgi:Family of unknown function (DUF6064)
MTLPFTPDEFFDVLSAYNERLWPFVVMLWLVTGYAVVMLIRARPVRPWLIPELLAFHWAWSGAIWKVLRGAPRCCLSSAPHERADLVDHEIGGVLEEEVVCVWQLNCLVIGEYPLKAFEIGSWKARILHAPDDQRGAILKTTEANFDFAHIRSRLSNLSWIERRDAATV